MISQDLNKDFKDIESIDEEIVAIFIGLGELKGQNGALSKANTNVWPHLPLRRARVRVLILYLQAWTEKNQHGSHA